jgi:hypothetical protein
MTPPSLTRHRAALALLPLLLCFSGCKQTSASNGGAGGSGASSAKAGTSGKAASGGSGGHLASNQATPNGGAGGSGSAGTGAAGRTQGGSASGGASAVAGMTASAGSSGTVAGPDLSDELFAEDKLPRFDITIPPESIAALATAPAIYTHASLKYGDTTLSDVGIRIKGEASQRTLDQKAAFKLKLDEFVAKQTLLGLKRITLNNMVSDPTFMSERLSYHLFREAKLPAPRCNNALVYVNGEYYGVYANVESEDKTFLSRWFSSNDGNLYEDGQGDFKPGSEQSFDLETNETLNDRTDLTALINAINSAGDSTYLDDLSATLNTEHFLRYTALEGALNQWDGYSYTYFEPNNFRLYHDPASNKFVFLPWGLDLTLKPYPVPPDDPDAAMYMREMIPLFEVPLYENGAGGRNSGGLIFVQCLERASCKQQYAQALREMIAVYDGAKLATLAAQFYAQIKAHVEADTRKELKYEEFEAAYQKLLDHLSKRSAAMRADMTAAGFTP